MLVVSEETGCAWVQRGEGAACCLCSLSDNSIALAKSSSSFLVATVPGSLATRAGLAFACSAAWEPMAGNVTPCSLRFLIIADIRLSCGSFLNSSVHSTIRAFNFSHTLGWPLFNTLLTSLAKSLEHTSKWKILPQFDTHAPRRVKACIATWGSLWFTLLIIERRQSLGPVRDWPTLSQISKMRPQSSAVFNSLVAFSTSWSKGLVAKRGMSAACRGVPRDCPSTPRHSRSDGEREAPQVQKH